MAGSYTVGFIDMSVQFEVFSLAMQDHRVLENGEDQPKWTLRAERQWFYLEAKPTVPSLGEVIRQIRMYQSYARGQFFIVSPDTRFRKQIESQGIGFIEVPRDVLP